MTTLRSREGGTNRREAGATSPLRAQLLAAAERFAIAIADAIEDADPAKPAPAAPHPKKAKRRKGVRWPASQPEIVVDDITAARAEQALRRAGILVR